MQLCATTLAALIALTFNSLANFPNNVKDADDEFLSGSRNAPFTGVPRWLVSEPYINLWILDQPLTYQTSYGQPIGFGIAFKQRNTRSNSRIFSLGPAFESSWLTYVEYTTNSSVVTPGAMYVALGGVRNYVADGVTPEFKSTSTMSKLTDGSGNFTAFQISYPSGARDIYGYLFTVSSSENYALLNQQIDPVGRTNLFVYDIVGNVVRLRQMIDWDNRTNTVSYDSTFTSQISAVADAYSHQATFGYDGSGRLNTITNVGGLNSSFGYDAQGLITTLTTVYSATTFVTTTTNAFAPYNLGGTNHVNRSITISELDGDKQLFLYRDQSTKLNPSSSTDLIPTSYPSSDVPNTSPLSNTFDNSYMDARNSYSWNQKQYSGLSSGFRSSGDFNQLTVADYQLASRSRGQR